uniref:STI1 domain-containing protein n=1 Tax=Craspedostauros australis TaxID=1486917 RepID=A0A7S0F6F5_9STRA|eukprot:CAMPEP_0198115888 /NCGR_PEP_ID=MMETSP1442-20131203/7927_1 /TAXON_ID= /ORGANISM="Craspedostauros australis, Strain CCMP3328" /LENGTH=267 /DNA_ID=CAMNT_0043773491 /DNA_START=86 /DNA_END=889 /DNA_ORIENTATION=-
MIRRIVSITGLSLLFLSPTAAQFGVGGGRGGRAKGASFQELNEQAKKVQQEGGAAAGMDMGAMESMWGDAMEAFKDPEMMKQMEEAMKMLEDMTPEQLEQQMQQAMKMLTDGDMMKEMIKQMDVEQFVAHLEETGSLPAGEAQKLREDPAYFQQKLQETMENLSTLFQDPEIIKSATDMMTGMKEVMNNPGVLDEMTEMLMKDMSDDKIEEARLEILASPDAMGGLFDSEDMQDILKDPKKWRDSVREGQGMLGSDSKGAGVASGEL